MAEPTRRIFTATLILGVPGAGKTSLLATFAEYLWETWKKILLLYSWDGGAIPTDLQRLMRYGLVRFWRCRTRSADGLGIETILRATKGYWPRRIDPETGETSPAVDLISPLDTRYVIFCRKTGEKLAELPMPLTGSTWCNACKMPHQGADVNTAETVQRSRGFEAVGGVAYDGLTSMGSVVLDHMDHARGAGQVGGEKSAFGGNVISGSVKLGGTNRADIGLGQKLARESVHNSLSIPYLVEGPVFTALSMEASDEGGLPIVGAKLPGRAATDEASAWFGNVFEMGRTTDEAGKEHFTLFLHPFTDPQNRRHLLKTSSSPAGLPEKLIDPIGQPWTQANLGLVFKMLDQDLQRGLGREVPDAPGLAQVPTEYGEPFQVLPSAAPPATSELPPLATPAAPTPAAAPAPPAPVGSAPPAVKSRRPARVDTAPAAAAEPPPTTTTPTTTTTTTTPTVAPEPEPVGVGTAPPPPPGMKPPAKVPGS